MIADAEVHAIRTLRTFFGPTRSPSQPTGTWPTA
jgi:hypothetical protein